MNEQRKRGDEEGLLDIKGLKRVMALLRMSLNKALNKEMAGCVDVRIMNMAGCVDVWWKDNEFFFVFLQEKSCSGIFKGYQGVLYDLCMSFMFR